MDELEAVDLVVDAAILRFQPGDVLAITFPAPVRVDVAERVASRVRARLDQAGADVADVLVLDSGATLSIVRQEA